MSVYAPAGDAAFDRLVQGHLQDIAQHVLACLPASQLDCLVLGGGYGRGEGGVVRDGRTARPYNDYDLVLVHRMLDRRRVARACAEVHRAQSTRCGVHVDVTPIHRCRVARLPPALTWYELGAGHRVVWGRADVLAPLVSRRLEDVHPTEWGRLVVNRSAGVVFARRVLRGEPCAVPGHEEPHGFCHRQLMKAWLALGDTWLADRALYSSSVRERLAAFHRLAGEHPSWAGAYRSAVRFKLEPHAPPAREALQEDLARLAPLLVAELQRRPSSPSRPAVALHATACQLPWTRWAASRPWRHPRERLRLGLAAELAGDSAERDRLLGSAAGLERIWARYG